MYKDTDWFSAVGERLGIERDVIKEVAARYNIKASEVAPTPKRLELKSIKFAGEKVGIDCPGEFDFAWDNLGTGVQWLLTDKNLKGKTSFFELIKWILRGASSGKLQDDVKSWIQNASLEFSLGENDYRVAFSTDEGFRGEVTRNSKRGNIPVASFMSESDFAETMSQLMMKELSLESVDIWQRSNSKGAGRIITHEWPFLAGAMFISTDYNVLLGDTKLPSGSVKLLQMYLGLPWVSTYSTASSVKKQLEEQNGNALEERKVDAERVQLLHRQIEEKRKLIASYPNESSFLQGMSEANSKIRKLSDEQQRQDTIKSQLEAQRMQMADAVVEDKRELQLFLDAQAAGAIFRRLAPTICPRCQKPLSSHAVEGELETGACCVCNEDLVSEEGMEDKKVELTERLKASQEALEEATRQKKEAAKNSQKLAQQLEKTRSEYTRLKSQISAIKNRYVLELELAKLEAELEQLNSVSIKEPPQSVIDCKIVAQLEKEAKARFYDIQIELLEAVSKQLVIYAQRFGMKSLSNASLKGNANLQLEKGGVSTSYSKTSPGEKLRLKVATLLAMLKVSEDRGIGRHPGLIMIDSPAAQEVTPTDLDEILTGIKGVVEELPHLQVFIASTATKTVLDHAEAERSKRAYGENYLW